MSSHIFEEVQRSCDRAGIIKDGRIVTVEDVRQLNEARRKTYEVELSDAHDVRRILESPLTATRVSDHRVRITVGHDYPELFGLLATCSVVGLYTRQESLEDVFMKYYGVEEASRE